MVEQSAHLYCPPTRWSLELLQSQSHVGTPLHFYRRGHRITLGTGTLSGLRPCDICEVTSQQSRYHLRGMEQTQVIRKPIAVTSLATGSEQALNKEISRVAALRVGNHSKKPQGVCSGREASVILT